MITLSKKITLLCIIFSYSSMPAMRPKNKSYHTDLPFSKEYYTKKFSSSLAPKLIELKKMQLNGNKIGLETRKLELTNILATQWWERTDLLTEKNQIDLLLQEPITNTLHTIKNADLSIAIETFNNVKNNLSESELKAAQSILESRPDYNTSKPEISTTEQKLDESNNTSTKTFSVQNNATNAQPINNHIKPTYAFDNIVDFENDTMKLHKIPIQHNSTYAMSATPNNYEKCPHQNPIAKLAITCSEYLISLNKNNYLTQSSKKDSSSSNGYSYAYAGISSFTRVNIDNSHDIHNVCDNKMYASEYDSRFRGATFTVTNAKIQGNGNKHSDHTSKSGGINSASHYDSKNPEDRKECANHAVSSEFKAMQLNGDKKGLEIKKEQLEEALKNTWLPWNVSRIHAQITEIDMLLKSPLTETLAIIKDGNLYTALYELNRLEDLARWEEQSHDPIFCVKQSDDVNSLSNIYNAARTIFYARPDAPKISTYHPASLENKVSTAIKQDVITITPEDNQCITETLDTLNDQSLEAVSDHIDTLVTTLQEQKLDTQANGKCFAKGLRLYALLQQYIENPKKRIVAHPDANVLIFNARKNALDVVAHNPTECSEQSFTLTPEAYDLLQTRGLDPEQFMYCVGNEVQHQLYSEFVRLLNAIAEIESNVFTQPMLDMVITYTHISQKYTEQNNIEKAFDSADLSWAWLDCAKAICIQGMDLTEKTTIDIVKGVMHGLKNAVLNNVNMVLHPIDTMSNVASTFCHLAYCFGKFMEPIMILDGETEVDAETITRVNEEWKENLQSVINATQGITVEGSAAFITEFIVSPKITKAGIGLLSHYSKTPVAQLVKIVKEAKDQIGDKVVGPVLKKVTDKLGNNVAVTANGVKVPVINTPQVSQRSMDKMGNAGKDTIKNAKTGIREASTVLRVNNMKEFFQTDFGKLLKNISQKTNEVYQGQTVYKVTENIKGSILKKGFYFYLDALHKDHLEICNHTGKVIGVLNLDGILNARKTALISDRFIKLS